MSEVPQNQNHDDEIDLFDLVDDIRDKWYWLVGSLIAGVAVAIAYVIIAPPEYLAEATITKAAPSELLPFNQPALRNKLTLAAGATDSQGGGSLEAEPVSLIDEVVFELDGERAFSGARSMLRSAATRKKFYTLLLNQNNDQLLSLISSPLLTDEQNLADFLDLFSYSDSSPSVSDTYFTVRFTLDEDAELARDVLNSYIEFSLALNEDRFRREFERKVEAELELYRTWAENFRKVYESEKARKIAKLEEAALIAESIGQIKPFYNTNDVFISSEPPLYMMGELALRQEATLLRKRSVSESEDIFVSGLSVIKNYITTLESIEIDWANVDLVEIDQPALLPLEPEKPKKLLVVAFGAGGGVLLGILAALWAAASSRHLRRSERNSLHF